MSAVSGPKPALKGLADLDTEGLQGYPYAVGSYGNGRLWCRSEGVRPRERGVHAIEDGVFQKSWYRQV